MASKSNSNSKSSTPRPSGLSTKSQYLILYNLLSFVLWFSILLRLVLTYFLTQASSGNTLIDSLAPQPSKFARYPFLSIAYPATWDVLKWTQTLAVVEIVHALLGLVRTSVMTTGMQVASRLMLVWGILYMFGPQLLEKGSAGLLVTVQDWGLAGIPGIDSLAGLVAQTGNVLAGLTGASEFKEVELNQIGYVGMLTAWSVTECIRYLYFVFFIGSRNGEVPGILGFLRYNTFFILYPLGISGECWLIYRSLPFATQFDVRYAWALLYTLAVYVPGSYILYTHMMTQRRKVMKGKAKAKTG